MSFLSNQWRKNRLQSLQSVIVEMYKRCSIKGAKVLFPMLFTCGEIESCVWLLSLSMFFWIFSLQFFVFWAARHDNQNVNSVVFKPRLFAGRATNHVHWRHEFALNVWLASTVYVSYSVLSSIDYIHSPLALSQSYSDWVIYGRGCNFIHKFINMEWARVIYHEFMWWRSGIFYKQDAWDISHASFTWPWWRWGWWWWWWWWANDNRQNDPFTKIPRKNTCVLKINKIKY